MLAYIYIYTRFDILSSVTFCQVGKVKFSLSDSSRSVEAKSLSFQGRWANLYTVLEWCACVDLSLPACLLVCPSVCLSVAVYQSVPVCVCRPLYLPAYLSTCLSVYLSVELQSINQCLFVALCACAHVCVCVFLSVSQCLWHIYLTVLSVSKYIFVVLSVCGCVCL